MMNVVDNNVNMESEENLNGNLHDNRTAVSSSGMGNFGLMDENGKETLSDNDSSGFHDWNYGNGFGTANGETEGSPDIGNADVSAGNAAHMEGNAPVETDVSSNDLYLPAVSVSDGDFYGGYYGSLSCSCGDGFSSPFIEEDVTHINNTLDALLFIADGILFFILFAWAEKKVSNGIRKLFHGVKPNS